MYIDIERLAPQESETFWALQESKSIVIEEKRLIYRHWKISTSRIWSFLRLYRVQINCNWNWRPNTLTLKNWQIRNLNFFGYLHCPNQIVFEEEIGKTYIIDWRWNRKGLNIDIKITTLRNLKYLSISYQSPK